MIRDSGVGSAPQDREKLLVTGITPVAEPFAEPVTRPLETVAEAEPVFADATGARARFGRRVGLAAGAVLIVFLGALGIGLAAGPSVPLTPWSEPSGRPSVKLSRPDVPAERPDDRRAAGGREPDPRPGGAAPAPPGSSSAPAPPAGRAPVTATSRPGNSQASPPAWGRKKKNR